jgi:hypothetical protein
MQAQQMFQTALQQTGGDYDQAVGRLRSQGVNTIGIETELAKSRKATYDAIKSHYDATKSQHDTLSGLAGQITDEASWQQYAPEMMKVDPDLAPMISSHPHYDPNVVHGFMALGEAGNKILDRVQKGNEALLKGEYSTFMGNQLATTENQDDLDKVIQAGQSAAVPGFIMARVPKVWSPNVPAMGMSWAMTAKEKVEESDNARTAKREAAAQAETVKQHGIQNKFEQQRIGLEGARVGMERQRLQREAAGGAAPNQPPSDAVRGYMDDIIGGASKLTDVPAAGGMRNSVVAQFKKEGYDLNKPLTAQAQARVDLAKLVLPQVAEVRGMADKINQMGLMGTLGGRWRSLIAHESAADAISGLTPEQQQLVGQFVLQAELLTSGTAMTHFGSRAGGSVVETFRNQLDPKNKDLNTFLGNLNAVQSVLGGYAQGQPGATKHGAAPDAASLRQKYKY